MIFRPVDHTCGNCGNKNTEAYKALGKAVCYELETRNGKPVAITVTDKDNGCQSWSKKKVGD